MPSDKQNLQFLSCGQCNGVGFLAEKKCANCHGLGIVAYLNGYILYWGKKVDFMHLKLYKFEEFIEKVFIMLLIFIAALGFLSLGYSIYLISGEEFLSSDFWLKGGNFYHSIFWLSVVVDMYLIYFFSQKKDLKKDVLKKEYENTEQLHELTAPPVNWSEVKNFTTKNKIDIAQSFNQESLSVINKAFDLAYKNNNLEIEPAHYIIAGLISSVKVQNVFWRLGIDLNTFAQKLGRVMAQYDQSEGETVFGPASQKILFKAYRLAYVNRLEEVDVIEIVQEAIKADKLVQEVLFDMNVTSEKITNVIAWFRIKIS